MVSPHGIKLAVYLISSYFGGLTAKVCECLFQRGTQSLAQIVRFTELSRENVRNCLLVLIHHNCVQAFAVQQEGAFGEAPKVITNYMALFDNIIHKLRFPKFLEIVSEALGEKVGKEGGKEIGKECEEIFERLLQHGRLSLYQIIDRLKQTSNQDSSDAQREAAVKELHGELHNRYNHLRKVRITLESSLMNLDDALMLFHDL